MRRDHSPAQLALALVLAMPIASVGAIAAQTLAIQNAVAQTVDERKMEGDRLFEQGNKLLEQNQNEGAIAAFQKALAIYRELKERQKEGQTLKAIGNAYRNLNDHARSVEYQQQALAIAREIKDPDLEARALNNIGLAYRLMGKVEQGMPYLQEAISVARRNQNRFMEVVAISNLGRSYADLNKYQEAILQYEQSLEINHRFLSNSEQEIRILVDLSDAHQALKNYSKMLQPIERAVELSRKLPDQLTLLSKLKLLASKCMIVASRLALANLGDSTYQNDPNSATKQSARRATQMLQEALQLSKALNRPTRSDIELYALLADSYDAAGDAAKAVQLYEQALDILRQFDDTKPLQLYTLSQLISVNSSISSKYTEQGKYTASLTLSNQILELVPQALQLAKELNDSNKEKDILRRESIIRFDIATTYWRSNEFARAEETAKVSMEVARKSKDFEYESKALIVLASVYNSRGEYQKALEVNRRNVEISQRLSPLDEALSLNGFALTYTLFGDIRKAIELVQQALDKYQAIDPKQLKPDFRPSFWGSRLLLVSFLSLQYEQLGEFDNALTIAQQRVQLARTSGISQEEVVALTELGNFYTRRDQLPLALETIQQAEKLLTTIKNPIVWAEEDLRLKVLLVLTEIHTAQGDYIKAGETAQQGLKIARQSRDRQPEINALDKIRNLYAAQGNAAKELETLNQIVMFSRQLPNAASRALALREPASTYTTLGDYKTSRELLQQSLTEAEKSQAPSYIAGTLGQLAQLALFQGNPKEAVALAEKALDATQRRGSIDDVSPLWIYALGYGEIGNEAMAMASIQTSLKIAQQLQQPVIQKSGLTILGSLHHKFGRPQEAITAYQSALAAQPNSSNVEIYAGLARVYTSLKQPATAIAFYKQAINGIEQRRQNLQGLPFDLKRSFLNARIGILDVKTVDIYRQLADELISQGRLSEAENVLALLKDQEIKDFTQPTRSQEKPPEVVLNDLEKALILQHTSLIAFSQKLRECGAPTSATCIQLNQELNSQIKAFNDAIEPIEIAVKQRCDKAQERNCVLNNSDTFRSGAQAIIQKQPGTLVISPLVLEDKVWILVAADGNLLTRFEVKVDRRTLGDTVLKLRQHLENRRSDIKELQTLSNQLYTWLIAPIETEIIAKAQPTDRKITNLVFALDRVTRYIPMSVLFDGKQYLTEKYAISTVLSPEAPGNVEGALPKTVEATSVLAMGVSQATAGFTALQNVPQELATIVRQSGIYPGEKVLDRQFTRTALEAKLPGHQILHIATHGEFLAQKNASFLLLGDGKLPIADIRTLGRFLQNVHLVVLSACQTAQGSPEAEGIEIPGISSYFLNNGAKAVIASLWSVDDASTSLLMQQLYRNLATGTMTKTEALRQAQLKLLLGNRNADNSFQRTTLLPKNAPSTATAPANYSHPFYWAPFILIGNGL